MENMELRKEFWVGRRVFVTGHTGFKGGWLCLWLQQLGAHVTGYALAPNTQPNLYELAEVGSGVSGHLGDIRDADYLRQTLVSAAPEIVLHLAAQPLVRASYSSPLETFSTNVMGTANLLEACRSSPSVKVVQVVTTDKVYENREWVWPYRETDRLGGHDPYSASKAASELVVASYRKSFLMTSGVSLASTRAGNVVGGGDWAENRLLPDCIRSFAQDLPVVLRSPSSVRPWQHVLEPIAGYLGLAEAQWIEAHSKVSADDWQFAQAFNFGPNAGGAATVGAVATEAAKAWGEGAKVIQQPDANALHEAGTLALDSSLARRMLGWRTRLSVSQAMQLTVDWYRRSHDGKNARQLCLEQIAAYETLQNDH